MTGEFQTFTPYAVYEQYASQRDSAVAHLLRRPLLEYVERYAWLQDELGAGQFEFPLLEIGPGSAWGLHQIQKEFAGRVAVGLDLDIDALREGRNHDTQALVQGDLSDGLPFKEKSFSTIVSFLVLEQIDPSHIAQIFRTCRKAAAPNAKLVIASFNRELFSPNEKHWFTPNQKEYTENELGDILRSSGWEPYARYGQRFVSPDEYKKRAHVFQSMETMLQKVPGLQEKKLIKIFAPRMLNILPSLAPHTTVECVESEEKREPVINVFVSHVDPNFSE
jgi:SAM-dependent methyltransferase